MGLLDYSRKISAKHSLISEVWVKMLAMSPHCTCSLNYSRTLQQNSKLLVKILRLGGEGVFIRLYTIHKIPITHDLLTTFPKLTTMTSPFRASNSALRDWTWATWSRHGSHAKWRKSIRVVDAEVNKSWMENSLTTRNNKLINNINWFVILNSFHFCK